MTTLQSQALLFRSLHVPGRPLVLPNAWDVVSARLVEEAGAAAVATTSAGTAWALGSPDGHQVDRAGVLDLVARITAAVRVPVTVDVEDGFAADPEGVAETVRGVLAAGAVGINLEDGLRSGPTPLRPIAEQAERIAAARAAAEAAGVPLYLNARVDAHRLPDAGSAHWLAETLARATAYLAAGADGVFLLGTHAPATVTALVEGIAAPLNLAAGPGTPSVAELAALGAARISAGSSIAEAAYAVVARAARELLTEGTSAALAGGLPYGTLNALLADRQHPAQS